MKIVGTKAELTDREKAFIRTWKRYFRAPGDWATDKMADGTSSFLDWAEFLAPEPLSLNIVEQILAAFAGQDETPTLYEVRRAYQDRTAGAACKQHGEDGQECGACHGTGCVDVLQAWPAGIHRAPVLVTAGTAARIPRDAVMTEARAPCTCAIGRRVAQRRGVSPSQVDWLFRCRVNGLTERLRLEQLVVETGTVRGEDNQSAAPPLVADHVAEWAATGQQQEAPI